MLADHFAVDLPLDVLRVSADSRYLWYSAFALIKVAQSCTLTPLFSPHHAKTASTLELYACSQFPMSVICTAVLYIVRSVKMR